MWVHGAAESPVSPLSDLGERDERWEGQGTKGLAFTPREMPAREGVGRGDLDVEGHSGCCAEFNLK